MSSAAAATVFFLCVCFRNLTSLNNLVPDDFPVQPVGQVQGAGQPCQHRVQQPGAAGHLLPAEEVSLALHTEGECCRLANSLKSTQHFCYDTCPLLYGAGDRVWRTR